MTVIDITRRLELTDLVQDLRIAARTIRALTMLERHETCVALVGELRERLEPHAELDPQGLEALDVWAEHVLAADPNAEVKVTIEISAECAQGASDQVKRAVSENARSLGISKADWE